MFFAIIRNDVVLSERSLDAVLRLVRELRENAVDVCVWQGCRVVAVAHGDGRVTRFEQPEDAGQLGAFDDGNDDRAGVDLGALAAGTGEDDGLPF
jgi:hypothetical protein